MASIFLLHHNSPFYSPQDQKFRRILLRRLNLENFKIWSAARNNITGPRYQRKRRRMASLESGVTELMTISNFTNNHCSTNMATNNHSFTNNLIVATTSRGVQMNNIAKGNAETESLL